SARTWRNNDLSRLFRHHRGSRIASRECCMRAFKILGLVLVGLILVVSSVVAAIGVGGAPLLVRLIEKEGSALVGRDIHLGRLDISWGQPTRIVAEQITVATLRGAPARICSPWAVWTWRSSPARCSR